MKRFSVIAFLILTMGLVTGPHAQLPEQRPQIRLNMDDVLRYVDGFTLAYIRTVTQRQKSGEFPLSLSDAKQLQEILGQLIRALASVEDRGSINPRGLIAETKETLRAALERARCGRDADVKRATFPPESVKDLKQLLSNRCNAITGIVASSKSPLSRDTIILLELHISYLIPNP